MWHGFLSSFLFSSTGSPPMNTWQTMLSICEPIADMTSLIWTAISLVGAKISTYSIEQSEKHLFTFAFWLLDSILFLSQTSKVS